MKPKLFMVAMATLALGLLAYLATVNWVLPYVPSRGVPAATSVAEETSVPGIYLLPNRTSSDAKEAYPRLVNQFFSDHAAEDCQYVGDYSLAGRTYGHYFRCVKLDETPIEPEPVDAQDKTVP